MRRALAGQWMLGMALGLGGCSHLVSNAVDDAFEAAGDKGNTKRVSAVLRDAKLQGASGDFTAAVLQTALKDPEVNAALENVARHATQGALAGISSPDQQKVLDETVVHLVDTLTVTLEGSVHAKIGPALQEELKKAVDGAVAQLLSENTRHSLDEMAHGIVEKAVNQLMGLLEARTGPFIRSQLTTNVGPATAEMWKKDLAPALSATVKDERSMLLADARTLMAEAVTTLHQERDAIFERLHKELHGAKEEVSGWLYTALGVAGLLSVIFGGGFVYAAFNSKKRERMLTLLTTSISQNKSSPATQELLTTIKELGEQQPAVEKALDKFVSERHLKVKRRKAA